MATIKNLNESLMKRIEALENDELTQEEMELESPQAIYKWISGKSLPSLDNFVILSKILHTSIEDILVVDGDVVRLWGCFKLTVQ